MEDSKRKRDEQKKTATERERDGLTRADLLKGAAVAGAGLALGDSAVAAAKTRPLGGRVGDRKIAGMNILVFLTDQQRAIQHFPPGWANRNMPGLTALKQHGLAFENAFTNACMCSPARSTLMSGYFPAQHKVKYTLETDMSPPKNPQHELSTSLKNPATVTAAAGYLPVYKGKFHCVKPMNGDTDWVPEDVNQYGFTRWDPPDAGADQSIPEEGGGITNNDGRFIYSQGTPDAGTEGALQYLTQVAPQQDQPFFMFVSLVNPHDVLMYPSNYLNAGYDQSWLQGEVEPPKTANESLKSKPSVQAQFKRIFDLTGPIPTRQQKRNYLNFYGNLMKSSDAYLVQILQALASNGMLDNTLVIATADHGEMGTTHGGLRQKNFNFYEEAIRVPLIYSNPRLWPKPQRTKALVSHVDFLPTLASLVHTPAKARANWEGVDYSDLILGKTRKGPQDYVVFTYDDFQSGQSHGPYPDPPQHIASIREQRYKLARYYDPLGRVRDQFEMYDLQTDPLEVNNLAFRKRYRRNPAHERAYKRLRAKLEYVENNRLRPLP